MSCNSHNHPPPPPNSLAGLYISVVADSASSGLQKSHKHLEPGLCSSVSDGSAYLDLWANWMEKPKGNGKRATKRLRNPGCVLGYTWWEASGPQAHLLGCFQSRRNLKSTVIIWNVNEGCGRDKSKVLVMLHGEKWYYIAFALCAMRPTNLAAE